MVILPVSSSKKGQDEDETGAGRLFSDAKSAKLANENFWQINSV